MVKIMWVVPIIRSTTYYSLSFAMPISLLCETFLNFMHDNTSICFLNFMCDTYLQSLTFWVKSNSMLCWQGWGLLGNWFSIKQFAFTGNLVLDISTETCFSSIILLSLFVYQSTYVVHSLCLILVQVVFSWP
jgi:hypothetical protein